MKGFRKEYKVYGADGHRQRESFADSFSFKTLNGAFIMIRNSDMTGTHEYSQVIVLSKNEKSCDEEFEAQLTDGIFENSRTGKIEVVKATTTIILNNERGWKKYALSQPNISFFSNSKTTQYIV